MIENHRFQIKTNAPNVKVSGQLTGVRPPCERLPSDSTTTVHDETVVSGTMSAKACSGQ